MADCRVTTYSFNDVAVTLDTHLVEGFWEGDDVVQVADNADVATPVVGADGCSIVSIDADNAVLVTLRLKPTSAAHDFLRKKVRAMKNGGARPIAITVRDTNSNEGGSGAEAFVIRQPTATHGKKATSRDWVLFVGCWNDQPVVGGV